MSDDRIELTLEGEEAVKEALRKRQDAAFPRAMRRSLRLSSELVLAKATENVSGKILKVQTGTLRRRLLRYVFPEDMRAVVGSPVEYAPVHEYGATIQHPGGTAYYFNERLNRTVFLSNKKAGSHPFPRTRPHAIPIPARPWLRPALRDSREGIEAIFNREMREAIAPAGGAS
jgi:phage gpG-like protein